MISGDILLVVGALLSTQPPSPLFQEFTRPPRAAVVEGDIETVLLSAPFASIFSCTEHPFGQLAYAGDALGTDCLVVAGVEESSGYLRPFRTDGTTNEDWYGWGEPVRAPADATVIGVLKNSETNTPGRMGSPPASTIQFQTDDGIVIVYGHVAEISVKVGDRVRAGEVVGKVGNDGMSRNPHIHIGAYRAADAVPLQIRWDLRSMGQ